MSRRAPAARGKADSNQLAIKQAIELLIGRPVMVLSAAGNGVEDLLVPVRKQLCAPTGEIFSGVFVVFWVMVECKVPPVRYTAAQKKWRAQTNGWPRITVTSAQDAVDQLRRLQGG